MQHFRYPGIHHEIKSHVLIVWSRGNSDVVLIPIYKKRTAAALKFAKLFKMSHNNDGGLKYTYI